MYNDGRFRKYYMLLLSSVLTCLFHLLVLFLLGCGLMQKKKFCYAYSAKS